jgi:hypothetical protein
MAHHQPIKFGPVLDSVCVCIADYHPRLKTKIVPCELGARRLIVWDSLEQGNSMSIRMEPGTDGAHVLFTFRTTDRLAPSLFLHYRATADTTGEYAVDHGGYTLPAAVNEQGSRESGLAELSTTVSICELSLVLNLLKQAISDTLVPRPRQALRRSDGRVQ